MHPRQKASFILTAITLRGIGSYVHGARLEIRPLTVLCGTNGSGKSTWLKALNVLRRSLDAGTLPYGFDVQDWQTDNIQLTNAFYHLAPTTAHQEIADPDATDQYGPPGTIGLEFRAAQDLHFSESKAAPEQPRGIAQEFLWLGKCPAGTRFRVRLAHPTYWSDNEPTPELIQLVELQIDDDFVLAMTGERDPFQRFEKGCERPRRAKPYELTGSPAFIPGLDPTDAQTVAVAKVVDLFSLTCESRHTEVPPELVVQTIRQCETRLRELLAAVLDGCFYVGALRQAHEYLSLEDQKLPEGASGYRARHVGAAGEYVWRLERSYADQQMRPSELGPFVPSDFRGLRAVEAFSAECRSKDKRLARIWELANSESKRKLSTLNPETTSEEEAAECVVGLLNSILDKRELFSWDCWSEDMRYVDCDGEIVHDTVPLNDDEIGHYVHQGVENLSGADLGRLNRLAVEEALNDPEHDYRVLASRARCRFEDHISYWLMRLTDIGIGWYFDGMPRLGHLQCIFRSGTEVTSPARSFLTSPDWHSSAASGEIKRLSHPCFGVAPVGVLQPPRQLSSGFHQVFPIIVQLSLMRQGEFFGIENPEVHLHPSLQIAITEMLVAHAAGGRQILIETHSDLVIRRVLRAILEEEVAQSQVQIYFTDLAEKVTAHDGQYPLEFRSSRLARIRVDEQGRIENWPEGFLDADVQESRRLVNIMYGDATKEDDDE